MAESLKEKIINLRGVGKSYRKIAVLLNCSTATVSYHCINENLQDIGLQPHISITENDRGSINEYYKTHTLKETAQYYKVGITSLRQFLTNKRLLFSPEIKKKNNYLHVKSSRQRNKIRAIEYKGGKCEICSYDSCTAALEFHHKDPSIKDFGISTNSNKAWSKIKIELDKCVLVCANCHREIHFKMNKTEKLNETT